MSIGSEITNRNELDDAIYLISHDLKSPVRALCEIPKWIEEDISESGAALPTRVSDDLELLQRQSARLQHMIEDLLEYSRIGRSDAQFDGDWDAIWTRSTSNIPGLATVTCTRSLSGKPAISAFDLQRLIHALVSNAVKHGAPVGGRIVVKGARQDDLWRLVVSDNGTGITEKDRKHAAKIFTTLQSRDAMEGSGMGLAIAEKVCAINEGSLSIETDELLGGARVVADF